MQQPAQSLGKINKMLNMTEKEKKNTYITNVCVCNHNHFSAVNSEAK